MFKQAKRRSVLGVLALALVFSLVGSLGTAMAATPDNPDITVNNCTITIRFTAGGEAIPEGQAMAAADPTYRVYIYDDFVIVYDETQSAQPGDLLTFQHTFASIGQVVPGIGIYIEENGQLVYVADPYDFDCTPGAAAPAPGCDVEVNIPAGSVVGSFVSDAALYYAPGQLVEPATSISAGNTAWVIGQDASGQYDKILWVCQFLWVEKPTMGPDYDNVWNGTSLPTGVVS